MNVHVQDHNHAYVELIHNVRLILAKSQDYHRISFRAISKHSNDLLVNTNLVHRRETMNQYPNITMLNDNTDELISMVYSMFDRWVYKECNNVVSKYLTSYYQHYLMQIELMYL